MARWEVSLNHSPKTSAGRQGGAKFWQAGDPERGVAKDKTSFSFLILRVLTRREAGAPGPPLPPSSCLSAASHAPSHRMVLCVSSLILLLPAKCTGAPGVPTAAALGAHGRQSGTGKGRAGHWIKSTAALGFPW